MSPLADLQRHLAADILMDGALPFPVTGRLTAKEALRIHRNTVLGALVGALRISFPTVDALVGEDFFDQAAALFAQAEPPRSAGLAGYGAGFAVFLANFPPCAGLPYLADVARLDFAIEQASQAPLSQQRLALEEGLVIAFPKSLAILALRYPAEEIRSALGDDAALAAITPDANERRVMVWREGREVRVRRMHDVAGRFLRDCIAGKLPAQALVDAAADLNEALASIQAEIVTAPFHLTHEEAP